MTPLRALDLFCGAGGVAKGLQRAGFHVTGIDIKPQPRYCGDIFIQGDATKPPVAIRDFHFIWASPPCQAFVSLRHMYNAKHHENLIPPTRALLEASGCHFAIENVNGAPLRSSLRLCGTQFGLGTGNAELWRHRHIETNFPVGLTLCRHGERERVIGVYGGHGRDRRRLVNTQDFSTEERRVAMGIDWMTGSELSQAIPPAYAEFIGKAAIRHIQLPGEAA